MRKLIRCIVSSESPNISNTFDLTETRNTLNDFLTEQYKWIDNEKLDGWTILVSATIRHTDGVGIFKRTKRFPSDKEFEISIAIPVPSLDDAPYGLDPESSGFYRPLDIGKFHVIRPHYELYSSLREYITKSIELSINTAFKHGLTCNGHIIRLEN
ncbi:hypothetical protein F3J45_10530 [Pantoea sp. Ap-967]|uniref:Imm9 family immunity protein n=1 Tax=Pantoea sp. Ap-967 TaxID=2608362 RepID=UPI001420AFE4|nr:Imm9 family immunity protein [Pantoea sp. Ap-967]NIE74868.1 hypothetical protein [Pantoea sp. Ap-967]